MIKKFKLHYQQWNRWQKHCQNSRFHKILVLLGLRRSPSFEMMKVGEIVAENTASIFGKISKASNSATQSFQEFGEVVGSVLEKGENDEK